MSFMFSRLGGYVIRRIFVGVGIVLTAVLAAILLIDMVEQMRTVGNRTELSIPEALHLTLLKTPMLIEQTLPFVILAGTMMAIIGLNRSSELVAMRAAGVSAWRFLTPAALVGLVIGLVTIMALNPLGARLYQEFESGRDDAVEAENFRSGDNGVWIRQGNRDGQVVIHADGVDASGTVLQGATFIFFDNRSEALRFTRRIRAATAELRPGFWQLTDLVEATPGARPAPAGHDACGSRPPRPGNSARCVRSARSRVRGRTPGRRD